MRRTAARRRRGAVLKRVVAGLVMGGMVVLGLWVLLFVRPREAEGVPAGRVEVQYWEKWTGIEAEQMKRIVDSFNQTVGKDKGIYVTYMSMTAVDQKTLVATAAGVPPDVAGVWEGQVVQFAEKNAIEPLEDLARQRGIVKGYYKRAYWDLVNYQGHLYGLISTPAAIALVYNKAIIAAHAEQIRAAGLDPNHIPETIEEFDRFSAAIDTWEGTPRASRLKQAGYIPMEPGWYVPYQWIWFGGSPWDPKTREINLLDPGVVASFDWIGSYTKRLGAAAVADFQAGFGNFASPQNAFMARQVAMVLQGPWMGNYIEMYRPEMNRWKHPKEWEVGKSIELRKENYEWGAAPFPTAKPGLKDACYVSADVLVIPRGARHRKEAFEFIAYVNRQDVMERLCSMHCKNSPLAKVSDEFVRNHPNPYIDVFERLAASEHAVPVPQCPIWREVEAELNALALDVATGEKTAREALGNSQRHLDDMWGSYEQRRKLREEKEGTANGDRRTSNVERPSEEGVGR